MTSASSLQASDSEGSGMAWHSDSHVALGTGQGSSTEENNEHTLHMRLPRGYP